MMLTFSYTFVTTVARSRNNIIETLCYYCCQILQHHSCTIYKFVATKPKVKFGSENLKNISRWRTTDRIFLMKRQIYAELCNLFSSFLHLLTFGDDGQEGYERNQNNHFVILLKLFKITLVFSIHHQMGAFPVKINLQYVPI